MNIDSFIDDEGEDDIDFVPGSDSDSSGGDVTQEDDPIDLSDLPRVRQVYEEMKASTLKSLTELKTIYPSCQALDSDSLRAAYDEVSGPDESIASQYLRHASAAALGRTDGPIVWQARPVRLPSKQIIDAHTQLMEQLNAVRVRKVRFAGKVYDIRIDPRTKQQTLACVTGTDATNEGDVDTNMANIEEALAGAKDVSALTKSKSDWMDYVKEDALKLRQHRKSSGAVLKKNEFLLSVNNVAAGALSGKRRRARPVT